MKTLIEHCRQIKCKCALQAKEDPFERVCTKCNINGSAEISWYFYLGLCSTIFKQNVLILKNYKL